MQPSLSFEQAPPFSVPVRFFLVAPWFGVAAGLYLALGGGEGLGSRWSGQALALTHLLGAGFMLQAMVGALLQFVPVAAGGNVWRPGWVAMTVQPLLLLGAALLAAGFAFARPDWLGLAAWPLMAGIVAFVVVLSVAVWRTPATGATLMALRLAIAGLLVAGTLGATLAWGMSHGLALDYSGLTDVHVAWALGGWALMLLAGVSYYVVPMFQLTPTYPAWAMRWLAPSLLAAILGWSLTSDLGHRLAGSLALLVATAFAGLTLYAQSRRRRRVTDATLLFFRQAMAALLAFALLGGGLLWGLMPGDTAPMAATLGALALMGVFGAAIGGMLYKILPFIAWLHLQRLGAPLTAVPNMKQIIPEPAMTGQLRLHALATLLVVMVPWVPGLAPAAGLATAGAFAWLGLNLARGTRRYLYFRDRIRAGDANRGS